MGIHLDYGGSTAARTLACPGWIKRSKGIKRRPAGAAAIDGSMHHEVQEMCQKDGTNPVDHIGFVYKEGSISREFLEDDLDLSNLAFNATNKLMDELDIDEMLVEPFVQLIPGVAGGSIDLLGLSADRKTLLDLDYKFGAVKVSPIEGAQHGLYGISAREDLTTSDMFKEVERVIFAIVQPKVKGVVSTWECDIEWLDSFEKTFRGAMEKDTLCAGAHCKFCPSEPYCKVKRQAVFSATLLDKKSHNELCAAADEVVRVENWVKAVKEELYFQIGRGVSVPGWKVVDKRPATKWVDEATVREFLKGKRIAARDIVKPAALMTPIQVGKILHKKGRDLDLTDFIVKVSSGTTVATEDDSRDAVVVTDVAPQLEKLVK